MDFYLRNGCSDTGVRTRCFGVEFIVLKMGSRELDKQKYWDLYFSIYRSVIPKEFFEKALQLLQI